jgi:myo-inositol-1(or 4)-monophosphatase
LLSLPEITSAARQVIDQSVRFIRKQSVGFDRSVVDKKGYNDLVSYVDRESERMLVDGLGKLIPGCGFIAEEETAADNGHRYRWIIDPLDGTTNFIHGVPCYAVSVALADDQEIIMGIVHEVNLNECFWSHKGTSAFVNDEPIQVSKCNSMSDSLVVTGFPYTDFSRMDSYMEVFKHFMKTTHGIRRPGSASVDLAWLAAGRFEVFYEYGLHAWDVAAGAFIVQQAGGQVTDFTGGHDFIFGKEIIATNRILHTDFQSAIGDRMENKDTFKSTTNP